MIWKQGVFMKTFFESLRRQNGFTLVELMVVVAIIGLLSSVAIPNFRKYQAKSKMSEAKLQLSAAYTAETAFFSDFNIYAGCLAYMGYQPNNEQASRYYAVGFESTSTITTDAWTSAVNSGLQSGSTTETCNISDVATANNYWFPAGKGTGARIASTRTYLNASDSMLGTQATNVSTYGSATGMTFVIGAAGVIDGNYTAAGSTSVLSISNNKELRVNLNGY